LVAVALPPSSVCTAMPSVLLPELVALALPPAIVCTEMPSVLLPELVTLALPPAVVSDEKPFAVPELVVPHSGPRQPRRLGSRCWSSRNWCN